jgi:hypothetical protein
MQAKYADRETAMAGEVSAIFCGWRVLHCQRNRS